MVDRRHRTEVLLDPEQYDDLSHLAEQEGRSLSDMVGELVEEGLKRRQQIPVRLEEVQKSRVEILARRGGVLLDVDVPALIEAARDERDEEILAALYPRRH